MTDLGRNPRARPHFQTNQRCVFVGIAGQVNSDGINPNTVQLVVTIFRGKAYESVARFTGLSAEGGVRPGVYAGLIGRSTQRL
jgi:hypothetical protein